ncbi:ECF transporter S component [Clostridium vincentii]|uniref:ECF transporter S component n=1 Tax=Clostridium vincentii TaxID=52704 RepID=A0A2T0BHQ3_9CLOT|nr:ECF transporter S component [Clostridium vincentii]PRR83401.1 hypothetical protein CLVI_09480 [Clostridium vincentii]
MQKESIKKTVLSMLIVLLIIPATILFGIYVLKDRQYYFISILIIIFTMVPFFMLFETRKPKAREIIIIAVLSSIAVAGRMAFFMIPQFKPVMAIVIITGIAFGSQAGFLTGAVSAFVSNFFFGQGPWTPWQMFAFGLVGFLAGILFKREKLKKNKSILCAFGGIATLVIYGGIVNMSSVLMVTSKITVQAVVAVYAAGFYFDMIHALSTVVFLFFISKPMIEKLDRIKVKYGLIESI